MLNLDLNLISEIGMKKLISMNIQNLKILYLSNINSY